MVCAVEDGKINIVLGGRGGNVIKTLGNRILLPSVLTLLSLIVAVICNSNRTEWSPIRSVIIRVTTKSYDRAAGVLSVYHEYDYRLNWTKRSVITN